MLSKTEIEERLADKTPASYNQCLAGEFGVWPREREALETAQQLGEWVSMLVCAYGTCNAESCEGCGEHDARAWLEGEK